MNVKQVEPKTLSRRRLIGVMAFSSCLLTACARAPARPDVADVLTIGTVGDELRFDKSVLVATAGVALAVVLKNNARIPGMLHNWVLMRAEDMEAVLADGIRVGADSNYVMPNDPRVIAHTKLVNAGQETETRFVAPAAGEYSFCCTFPGHAALMNGRFRFSVM